MVCLDANVVLELLLKREAHRQARQAIQTAAGDLCITMLSVHIIVHFARKAGAEMSQIFELIDRVKVLDITATDYEWAKTNARNDDFEDALQLAAAIRSGCTTFITFDQLLNKTYHSLPQLKVQLV